MEADFRMELLNGSTSRKGPKIKEVRISCLHFIVGHRGKAGRRYHEVYLKQENQTIFGDSFRQVEAPKNEPARFGLSHSPSSVSMSMNLYVWRLGKVGSETKFLYVLLERKSGPV